MSLNVYSGKGWWRLWVLASLVYAVGMFLHVTDGLNREPTSSRLIEAAVFTVMGSVAALLFGLLVGWVVKGFRKQQA